MMSFVSKPTLRAAYKEYSLKAYSWMKEGLNRGHGVISNPPHKSSNVGEITLTPAQR
jgi:hypothetical protein